MKNNIKQFVIGMLIAAGPVSIWVNANIPNSKPRVLGYQANTTDAIATYNVVSEATISAQLTQKAEPIPTNEPTPTEVPVQRVAVQETLPKPTTQPVQILAPEAYNALIDQYAAEYGADPNMMKKIAKCESGYDPDAISPSGAYHGMYQFVASTWISNREVMGLDPDPGLRLNAEESIRTAAFKMGRDGYSAWPVCSRK